MRFWILFTCFFTSICGYAEESSKIFTVIGNGETTVTATLVDITVSVEVVESSAIDAKQSLTRDQAKLLEVLRGENLNKVQTTGFWITPRYSEKEKGKITSYKGSSSITFSTTVEKAGSMIDLAIYNGANKTQNISVHPSNEQLEEARKVALRNASENGVIEAKIVMEALGLTFGNIYEVEIISSSKGPLMYLQRAEAFSMYDSKPVTEVTEQEVTVKASVKIKIEFDP